MCGVSTIANDKRSLFCVPAWYCEQENTAKVKLFPPLTCSAGVSGLAIVLVAPRGLTFEEFVQSANYDKRENKLQA